MAQALGADWKYDSAADVMEEIGRGRCHSTAGPTTRIWPREYGRQWPCTKDRPLGTRFLFAKGTAGSRASSSCPSPSRRSPSRLSKDFPLTLVFGHSLYYWNQNVLIQHSETLKREYRILLLDYPGGLRGAEPR